MDDSFCNTFVYRLFIDEIILVDNKIEKKEKFTEETSEGEKKDITMVSSPLSKLCLSECKTKGGAKEKSERQRRRTSRARI